MTSLTENGQGTPGALQTRPPVRSAAAGASLAGEPIASTQDPGTAPIRIGPGEDEPHFLVTTFKDGELTEAILTRRQVLALDDEEVDLFWDRVFGRVSIKRPDGVITKTKGEIPGLGPDAGIPFLEDIL